jgi:DNA-binding transcriptional regulator/RsmH inhibitor MraZ
LRKKVSPLQADATSYKDFRAIEDSDTDQTHEELAVLDRAGRLQIPQEYLDALGLKGKNKIRVELDSDRIILSPPEKQ